MGGSQPTEELAPPLPWMTLLELQGETLWAWSPTHEIMELGSRRLSLTPCVTLGGALPCLCLGFPIHETTEL